MTGINRTSNALWRDPIPAVADSKPVKLSAKRWAPLLSHPGFGGHELAQVIVERPVEIDGITFLPAVYRAA